MKKFVLLSLGIAVFTTSLLAIDLPKAPSGFTWQEVPELKAAFLKPTGWFFKQENNKGTLAYFITQEGLSQNGEFATGLTVNVFHFKQDSAVDHGRAVIDQMATQHHVKIQSRAVGPFQEFACELKDTDASGTIQMHALTVANPKTNTLYLFIFESPVATWDSAWKLGQQMMDTLAIDDEI
jgi:hypothetical protein